MRPLTQLVLTALALLTAAGCEQRIEEPLDPADVRWTTYTNDAYGITFEHPSVWAVVQRGNSIVLQGNRATAMRVTLADRREAERRGLWGRTPVVREERLGEHAFAFYRYRHYDGPSYVPTLAFVTPHREVELGVEFRTGATEPSEVERRVLSSLRLR